MKIRKFATITLLVISSFAANGVAPSKTELEAMYDKAFREFDANNYEQALKDLDAIDARQPDLAESHNLRGVIMMRQKDYRKAEAALRKALEADPKFWNARFNLAEIPFLEKNWPEARKRFQELLSSNASDLQREATQLIQYKILITHLMEGKDDTVKALIDKFELAPDTPAVHYANAAMALNKKDEAEARKWLTNAEKAFSPQLNKLFAESLYAVGWLEKPAGQTRAALELNSAAERAAQTKAFAKAKFEEAEMALQQRDFTAARKLIDEADAADPNQAPILNLRGEILLDQGDYAAAETEFRKALKADPKFRDAQYNLAQIPFKQKDYAKARERFEQLFATTTGADKDRAAQLIKFKIYLTFLLEGKDARAQKMMEQFQFTGDTPALYYAQAAWEFAHNNPAKASDWVTSARKIYPPALNGVFADTFYDLGWFQTPHAATSPAAIADAGQPEPTAPAIEPTPLPAVTLAQNTPAKNAPQLAPENAPVPGMEATTSSAEQTPAASTSLAAAASPSVETPVASTASPAAARAVNANPSPADADEPAAPPVIAAASASPATVLAPAQVRESSTRGVSAGPDNAMLLRIAAGLIGVGILAWMIVPVVRRRMAAAPAQRASAATTSEPELDEAESVGPVEQLIVPTRLAGGPPQVSLQLRASEPALRRPVMPSGRGSRANGSGYANGNGNGNANGHGHAHENGHGYGSAVAAPAPALVTAAAEPSPVVQELEEGVGEPMPVYAEHSANAPAFAEPVMAAATATPVEAFAPAVAEPAHTPEPYYAPQPSFTPGPSFSPEPSFLAQPPMVNEPPVTPSFTPEPQPEAFASTPPSAEPIAPVPAEATAATSEQPLTPWAAEEPISAMPEPTAAAEQPQQGVGETEPVISAVEPQVVAEPVLAAEEPAEPTADIIAPAIDAEPPHEAPALSSKSQPAVAANETIAMSEAEPIAPSAESQQQEEEPIGQGQPVPYLTSAPAAEATTPAVEPPREQRKLSSIVGAAFAGIGALRKSSVDTPLFASKIPFSEPSAQQSTTPAIMAQPVQPTPAPVIRGPQPAAPGGAPQAAGGMQPQPSQQSAPAMQPMAPQAAGGAMHTAVQLTFSFEIASLQLTPNFKMGSIQLRPTSKVVTMRLAPSQQPQPAMNLQVTFEIASVQGAGNALGVIRLTPSQQQRPSMISSPAFNITGLQLVSGAESAPVQLTPSTQGQASVLVTAAFQIATVEFSPSFEIASIILNATSRSVNVQLPGTGPSAVEAAPVFDIANVQLSSAGEITMMQLNPRGAGAPAAGAARG